MIIQNARATPGQRSKTDTATETAAMANAFVVYSREAGGIRKSEERTEGTNCLPFYLRIQISFA